MVEWLWFATLPLALNPSPSPRIFSAIATSAVGVLNLNIGVPVFSLSSLFAPFTQVVLNLYSCF